MNRLFLEKDWTKWDGGKVGGMPVSFPTFSFIHFFVQRVLYQLMNLDIIY